MTGFIWVCECELPRSPKGTRNYGYYKGFLITRYLAIKKTKKHHILSGFGSASYPAVKKAPGTIGLIRVLQGIGNASYLAVKRAPGTTDPIRGF